MKHFNCDYTAIIDLLAYAIHYYFLAECNKSLLFEVIAYKHYIIHNLTAKRSLTFIFHCSHFHKHIVESNKVFYIMN